MRSSTVWVTEQRTAVLPTTMATMPMAAASISLFFFCMFFSLSIGT